MKTYVVLVLFVLSLTPAYVFSQTGPWAKYDAKLKGDALVREADGGNLAEVKSIVAGGGDVNYQTDYTHLTPLMAAATANRVAVVQYLLSAGADASLQDHNGKTALDRAKSFGASGVVALLASRSQTEPAPPQNAPAAAAPMPKPTSNANSAGWPQTGAYQPGDSILYFAGSWKRGIIKEAGTPYNPAAAASELKEAKYLITNEGFDWPEWTDGSLISGRQREAWWTSWFAGTWELGEVMAVNTRTEGAYERTEIGYAAAREKLVVNSNGTYQWSIPKTKTITGIWAPAPDGPGIVLRKGYKGLDWTLRNQTSAITLHIRKLETARLFPPANNVMSIAAKRPAR